ncbi:MAG: glycosyltransferase family 2 protein [Lachnospiraceae bacterium]|nr:glycosyltransferase family 2 protein [Lachnospiraceae bacterium]
MNEQIIYVKFSNDRKRDFRIRTEIAECGGQKTVRKIAACKEAVPHVRRMYAEYRLLTEVYGETRFVPNRCELKGDTAEFEYLDGRTMEEILDRLYDTDRDAFRSLLKSCLDEIGKTAAGKLFSLTEEYLAVFGQEIPEDVCEAAPASDVDLLFSNIIVTDGGQGEETWHVIDYEWTLPFPVPVLFIKWRALHYYLAGREERNAADTAELYEMAGFSPKDIRRFAAMEEHFQKWIAGDTEAVRELYPAMTPGAVYPAELMGKAEFTGAADRTVIYFDRGDGYSEADALRIPIGEDGRVEAEFAPEGAVSVRIDPAEMPAACVVREITADGKPFDRAVFGTNGRWADQRTLVFGDNDPMIIVPGLSPDISRMKVSLEVKTGRDDYTAAVNKALKADAEELQFLKERLACEEETCREILRRVESVKGTKAIRAYRYGRKRLGKTDPFDSIRPKLQNHQGIHLHLDHRYFDGPGIVIQGWIYDADYCGESLRVVNCLGLDAEAEIERVVRDDVNATFHIDTARKSGFNIRIPYESIGNLPYVLRIENPRGVLSYDLHIELDPEKRRERRELIRQGTIVAPDEPPMEYDDWMRERAVPEEERERQRQEHFPYEPKISVVIPLFNTPAVYLTEICDSILNQTYANVELCLADGSTEDGPEKLIASRYAGDGRVRYRRLAENRGISENTNEAIRMAEGDIIMLADHDDTVDPSACYEIVKAFNSDIDVDIVYTDEDKITQTGNIYYDPNFKPDYNLDLLRSNNYICHIFAVRRMVVQMAGLLRSEFDGAQDYDFILRCCEKARGIRHVPKALYHWRAHMDSTAGNPESKLYAYENGRRAVAAHYERLGISAQVEMTQYWGRYRTIFAVQGRPLVSIIIPNRDHAADLRRCLDSVFAKSTYQNYEILILENGSQEPETKAYYGELTAAHANVRILEWKEDFNYSAINNFGAKEAAGEYLLFLNNDTEVLTPSWIEELLGHAQRPDVGCVGAKLLFPDGTIQHAGVVLGMGGAAGHMFAGLSAKVFSYGGRANSTQDLSAVTAACMMTRRSVFLEAGGFDPEFRVAFNDVDYCLKLREKNLLVVENVFAELVHYESATRGSDMAASDSEKHRRFLSEANRLRAKWPAYYEGGDPYFNPNLEPNRSDFALKGQYPTGNPEEL